MRSSIKKQSVEIKQNTTCRYASPIPAICKQSCTRGPQFNIPFRLSFIQSDYRSFQPHRIPVIPFKRNIRNVMSGPRERERERERDRETERERERRRAKEKEGDGRVQQQTSSKLWLHASHTQSSSSSSSSSLPPRDTISGRRDACAGSRNDQLAGTSPTRGKET